MTEKDKPGLNKDIHAVEDDWYLQEEIVVHNGQQALRIDKYLMTRLNQISRSRIQQAIEAGSILVNRSQIKSNYKVRPKDLISVFVPHPPQTIGLEPEDIPLDIVYEDKYVVVLNKASGLVVHPGIGNHSGTLVNALLFHFGTMPEAANNNGRPGLVHRLDKDTSGLMVIAREEFALVHLAKQFFNHTINRRYVALVWGSFAEKEGTIEGNIGRHKRHRELMTVYPDGDFGKTAITHYKVLEDLGYVSLVECKLETGRTHQIRVHMKHIGHPIFNDSTYGGNQIVKGTVFTRYKQFVENNFKILPRQALHARLIGFEHPKTGKYMEFSNEMPDEMLQVLNRWRTYLSSLRH